MLHENNINNKRNSAFKRILNRLGHLTIYAIIYPILRTVGRKQQEIQQIYLKLSTFRFRHK